MNTIYTNYNDRQIKAFDKPLNENTAIDYALVLKCEMCGEFLITAEILKSLNKELLKCDKCI